jgi:putative DNA methylase
MLTWWSRKPFTSSRALLFAQLVNDPGFQQGEGFTYGMNKKAAARERKRLFDIMEELVRWDNTNNEVILEKARTEIRRSWNEVCELNADHPKANVLFNPEKIPGFHDPFSGGGSIPLEAQRLGLESFASDLNPVAVVLNKAMIEIPAKYADFSPVNPESRNDNRLIKKPWVGTSGLAADVMHYGKVISRIAKRSLASSYPDVEITKELAEGRSDLLPYVGRKCKLVAWQRARTVVSPNPAAAGKHVPLISTFVLSSKSGKEVYIEPVVNGTQYTFRVVVGKPPKEAKSGTKLSRGGNFRCLITGTPIDAKYIRDQGMKGKLGTCQIAVIVDGNRTRLYLPPIAAHDAYEASPPAFAPQGQMNREHRAFTPAIYGIAEWQSLFTNRQLTTLEKLFSIIDEVRETIESDAVESGRFADKLEATNYANSVTVYFALATARWADFSNTICCWNAINQNIRVMFASQAIRMSWEFSELAPFSSVGPWTRCLEANAEALSSISTNALGHAVQADAISQDLSTGRIVATDPPYYDNVPYSDLSDFFYVWLRRSLRPVYPALFSTIAVPKDDELVVTPSRHGGRDASELFFLEGMRKAMSRIASLSHPAFPVSLYYAFKQSETSDTAGTSSTGWVTFLEAVLKSGLQIVGTWPVRTEKIGRTRSNDSNALASSILLVCRKRDVLAPTISRREFIRQLNMVLPDALDSMTRGGGDSQVQVAPVDLSQAIIGPGMAVFSKYASVLEADGTPMTVRTALQLINRFLAEDDFDADTQFCLHWFEQYGWEAGRFGEADTLARAKGTSVDGVKQAGVLDAAGGIVRLLKWRECSNEWDPKSDQRLPIWEVLHQLIRVLNTDGEAGAAAVFAAVQSKAEAARQLAYRLYTLCERKNWAEDARAYNEVVTSWSGIEAAAAKEPGLKQGELFE